MEPSEAVPERLQQAPLQPELEAQRERLKLLPGRLTEQKAIDARFDDLEGLVNEMMSIEPAPFRKVAAVPHRELSTPLALTELTALLAGP